MNCSECEKRIYLYRELTPNEKKITDEHIAHCSSCRTIALKALQQQEVIRKVRSVKSMPQDPAWLTQRIMNSIERKESHVSRVGGIATFLDSLFVRYAFSFLSIVLIAFFYIEQGDAHQVDIVAKVEIKQGTILNTSSFLKTHLKNRENRETTISVSRYSYHRSERIVKTL
jgi:predicted anti-sigma-YlaC factor YlaD